MTDDPTYIKASINANPEWKLAFWLSEIDNDNAPLGWSKYIMMAKLIIMKFNPDLSKLEEK
jgi:hypothetical protein